MAVPTGTTQTYTGVVNKEDLSDLVYMISPTDTPFMSSIGRGKATGTLHEWTKDSLDAAANNAKVEGDDSVATVANPGVRADNRTQISRKTVRLSGTQQAVDSAGKLYTMGKQMAKKSAEIKRDMEFALCQNTTAVVGSAAVARQLRGLEGWVATNNSFGAGGAAPDPSNNVAPTDGTQRALTEALVKDALQQVWDAGGSPNLILCGGPQKQLFSTFSGGATQMGNADDKRLVAAVDFYVSDFGALKVVPNRFQRSRTLFILETAKWKVAYLRPFKTEPLAKTGDSDAKQLVVEYTLEACNEASSGAVRDLS